MSDEKTVSYLECRHPLTEIDNYGQRLKGCMTCNIWWSLEGTKVPLPEEDNFALRQLRWERATHPRKAPGAFWGIG